MSWQTTGVDVLVRFRRWCAALPVARLRGSRHSPAIFVLLFWSAVLVAIATAVFDPLGDGHRAGGVPVALSVLALIVAWSVLPWAPRRGGRIQSLALPGFAVAVFAVSQTTNALLALPLYSIAVANGVFLLGFARGVAVAALTVLLAFASGYFYMPGETALAVGAFLGAIMVPVAAFVVGVCTSLVELKRANAELRRQADTVRQLAISEERARMAREVHDSVGHHLTAIHLQLQNAERFADKDPTRSWRMVSQARESTLAALAEVRRSVRALKPPALDERSGVAAMLGLARSFDGTGPAVSFKVEGTERTLSGAAELVLYRAMQEGLTNAAKHSGASRVRVSLAFEPDATRLTVVDDGHGARNGSTAGGFGLDALRERVAALGGTLVAGSQSSAGFELRIVLPREPDPELPGQQQEGLVWTASR